jgi:hydroxymethylbilane synthase
VSRVVKIGTRGSRLALAQTESVVAMLRATSPGIAVEIVTIRTEGDRNQSPSLPGWGSGVFVREIEAALLSGAIDCAVHSLKDVPPQVPDGLALVAMPARADARDVLLSGSGAGFLDLPPGACIGTSSMRREAFLRAARPDLTFRPIRGNVDTRIGKLLDPSGPYDGIVLAAAGIERLELMERAFTYLEPDLLLPAPGQGTLAVEARADDDRVRALLSPLDDPCTRACALAERTFVTTLESGCRLPVGALATIGIDIMTLRGAVASPDGSRVMREEIQGRQDSAERLGVELASRFLASGAAGGAA